MAEPGRPSSEPELCEPARTQTLAGDPLQTQGPSSQIPDRPSREPPHAERCSTDGAPAEGGGQPPSLIIHGHCVRRRSRASEERRGTIWCPISFFAPMAADYVGAFGAPASAASTAPEDAPAAGPPDGLQPKLGSLSKVDLPDSGTASFEPGALGGVSSTGYTSTSTFALIRRTDAQLARVGVPQRLIESPVAPEQGPRPQAHFPNNVCAATVPTSVARQTRPSGGTPLMPRHAHCTPQSSMLGWLRAVLACDMHGVRNTTTTTR